MVPKRNKHSSLAVLMKMSYSVKLTRISFPEAKCFQMLCLPTLLMQNFVVWSSKLNIIEGGVDNNPYTSNYLYNFFKKLL